MRAGCGESKLLPLRYSNTPNTDDAPQAKTVYPAQLLFYRHTDIFLLVQLRVLLRTKHAPYPADFFRLGTEMFFPSRHERVAYIVHS